MFLEAEGFVRKKIVLLVLFIFIVPVNLIYADIIRGKRVGPS
jgi:hypothetical protein